MLMSEYRLPRQTASEDSMFAIHKGTTSLCLMTDGRRRGVIIVGRGGWRGLDGKLTTDEAGEFDFLPINTAIEITT